MLLKLSLRARRRGPIRSKARLSWSFVLVYSFCSFCRRLFRFFSFLLCFINKTTISFDASADIKYDQNTFHCSKTDELIFLCQWRDYSLISIVNHHQTTHKARSKYSGPMWIVEFRSFMYSPNPFL